MTRRGLAELLAIVAPPACVACREPLRAADELLCAACLRALPWLRGQRCPRCGLPRHRRGGCPAARAAFARSWAPMAYEGPAQALVQALKFRAALPAAGVMAAQVAATLPDELRGTSTARAADASTRWAAGAPPDAVPDASSGGSAAASLDAPTGAIVVPVPPQRRRRRARGFDPAGELAAGVATRLGLPLRVALERRDRASRQTRAGRGARRAAGRIDVAATGELRAPVLLVDDVHTTGATLHACARALVDAGAPAVAAVTYARTL